MKKTVLLSVICLLSVISLAFGLDNIALSPSAESIIVSGSDSVVRSLVVNNTNSTDNLTLTLPSSILFIGNRENKTISVSYNASSPLFLDNSANRSINYSFNVPSSIFNDTYTGVLNFTANNSDSAALTISLLVLGTKSATITSPNATSIKGKSVNGTVTITNTGNTDLNALNFSITNLVDIANASSVFSSSNIVLPGNFNLNFSQSASKNIQFNIPATQLNGTYQGNLTLNYDGTPANATITLTVLSSQFAITFSESQLNFGTAAINSTVTKILQVTSSGNDALTNFRLVNQDVPTKYNLTFNDTAAVTLPSGISKEYSLRIIIPTGENSGEIALGNILAQSDQVNATLGLKVKVEGKLVIDKVEVDVDGDTDSDVNNGESVSKTAKPGDEVRFDVTIQNKFTKSEDLDLEDVVVTITIEDIDDGDDLEEESAEFDVRAADDSSEDITFTIPEDAEEDTYDIIIEAEGEDENGNDHDDRITIRLRVERERHKIIINRAELESNILTCKKSNVLTVTAKNIGSSDEDDAVLTMKNAELGIDVRNDFNLDQDPDADDNEFTRALSFTIPAGLLNGDYPIDIRLYYENSKIVDTETVTLKVSDCPATAATAAAEEEDETITATLTTPTATSAAPTSAVVQVPPTLVTDLGSTSYRDSALYTALLIFANVVVVILVVVLFLQLLRKPAQ